ncbi:metal ABC transporter ATPase [Synechocystis salina LEGE 06155]|nr:metal ABC transporter ATPase [Synechocystis salina LEGE 06155]
MENSTVIVETNPGVGEPEKDQLAVFLQEHEEVELIVPVLLGLFITSRLQLRGANALLVNLGVASVLRQVFKQLKQTSPRPIKTSPPSTTATKLNTINSLGEGITIVHSVPGRLRLKVEQIVEDRVFAKRLERLLNNDDHVIKVRVNRPAASVTINYEQGHLSDLDLGLRLMGILQEAHQTVAA